MLIPNAFIVCGESVFNVHRAIVCTQSKFFKVACKNGFKVRLLCSAVGGFAAYALMQEGITRIVELEEEDEIHIRAMIEYLYTSEYLQTERDATHVCTHGDDVEHSLVDTSCRLWLFGVSVMMHVLADKYGVDHLSQYACARLDHQLRGFWTSLHYYLDLIIIKFAYHHSQPNDQLREAITQYVIDHIKDLAVDRNDRSSFFETMKELPDLSEALLRHLCKYAPSRKAVDLI